MVPMENHTRAPSGPSKAKSSSKRTKNVQPYLTSNPLPLPSLDERLFASYVQHTGPKETPRPNPTHSTRAHQLPTPYIGPPKRKYLGDQLADNSSGKDSAEELPNPAVLEKTDYSSPAEPSSSQMSEMSSDIGSPAPSSSQQSITESETPDVSEAAVMLAALSSVSTKSPESTETSNMHGGGNPNPELVLFLRAYLAALESQQQSNPGPEAITVPVQSAISPPQGATKPSLEPAQAIPTIDPILNVQTPAPSSATPLSRQSSIANKENQKPPPTTQPSKDTRLSGSSNISPLGSRRVNSINSDGHSASTKSVEGSAQGSTVTPVVSSQPNSSSRKRKLSDAAHADKASQTRRRSSSTSKRDPPVENLSGVRVNTGWGGLRVRSDGTLWGEHLPQVSATLGSRDSSEPPLQKPVFFRSSAKTASTVPVRKGPYVVPDWAKGVPAPAPPPRPDPSNENGKKEKKQGKSRGLERLGGRGSMKRTASASTNRSSDVLPRPITPPRSLPSSQEPPLIDFGTHISPLKTPIKAPPIFAQPSPAAKSTMASFFQIFQTSPCRPASERKNTLFTPLRCSATSPIGSGKHSSLFTPSPVASVLGSGIRPRKLFAADDPPPSPTPTKKSIAIPEVLTARHLSGSPEPPKNNNSYEDPPSSLPVASSDDLTDDSTFVLTPLVSSDSTVMNSSKVHDWSALDLPPSSPPPPSSPSMTPIYGSDLPCSDIPSSSDMSEVESPSFGLESDNSNVPSPAGCADQTATPGASRGVDKPCDPSPTDSAEQLITQGSTGNIVLDYGMDGLSNFSTLDNLQDPFSSDLFASFEVSSEDGPSAVAAVDALRNGLGQENFTEVWNLLQALTSQPQQEDGSTSNMNGDSVGALDSVDFQGWVTDGLDTANPNSTSPFDFDAVEFGFDLENGVNDQPAEPCVGDDPAIKAAVNFEELLKGCLV